MNLFHEKITSKLISNY